MAKKTKDSNLSLEERLEQALIPNWDEPYKLPENWCWVNFGSLGTLGMGQTILSKDLKEEGVPVYSATEEDKIFGYIADSENTVKLCMGDIVIPARGNSIGHVKYISCDEASCTQTTMFFKPFDKAIGKCVYYYMQGNKDKLFAYHGNAIPQITITNITKKEIPIPPLEEQQRIVEQIETLFAKLDEAKEKAQEVVDGFETRKAAILHKAFSGELTAKWREKNEISANSWQETKLGYVLREIKYGSSEKSDYSYTGIPVLRIPNIGDMELIFDDLKFLRQNDCLPNEYLEEEDILIIRSNGSKDLVGKCALVKDLDQKYTYASFLIRLRVQDSVSASYIVWYLNSENARKQLFRKAKSSAGIHNINSKEIADIDITIPHIAEQNEIVDILSALIEKEKHVKETAEAVIEQIDTMKKAILARAFRGELGTNDPDEESAVELLKKIL